MEIIFGEEIGYPNQKYTRPTDPGKHIEHCPGIWQEYLRQEWFHLFIHNLEVVPRSWYTSEELRQGTIEWEILAVCFT